MMSHKQGSICSWVQWTWIGHCVTFTIFNFHYCTCINLYCTCINREFCQVSSKSLDSPLSLFSPLWLLFLLPPSSLKSFPLFLSLFCPHYAVFSPSPKRNNVSWKSGHCPCCLIYCGPSLHQCGAAAALLYWVALKRIAMFWSIVNWQQKNFSFLLHTVQNLDALRTRNGIGECGLVERDSHVTCSAFSFCAVT